MDQQFALALIQYLNRAVLIVPTFGIEWDAIRRGLAELEKVASGQCVAAIAAKPTAQAVQEPSPPHVDHRAA